MPTLKSVRTIQHVTSVIILIRRAALYGKPYITAAKDTWRMFKDRGIDALVNDSLVSMSTAVILQVSCLS